MRAFGGETTLSALCDWIEPQLVPSPPLAVRMEGLSGRPSHGESPSPLTPALSPASGARGFPRGDPSRAVRGRLPDKMSFVVSLFLLGTVLQKRAGS